METETKTKGRPVRVVIEGRGETILGRGGVLRVTTEHGDVHALAVGSSGVTVEWGAEPRTWTDGDVVQHPRDGWTLTRMAGEWRCSLPNAMAWADDDVTRYSGADGEAPGWGGPLQVLRYQADEQ